MTSAVANPVAPSSASQRPDWASASLDHVLRSDEYVRVPAVPIFDEHDEYDAKGNLVRRFSAAELQEIARRCNARAQQTGDLSPFGPGHTFDDVYDKAGRLIYKAKEEDQPIPIGYLHNYQVGRYGPEGKLGILADMYVKRRIIDSKGQVVDGLQYLKTFPRRSVELWPEDGIIDWVAVLRRTPQRDLGLLTYAKAVHYVREARAGASSGDGAQLVPAAALFGRGPQGGKQKLRYAMGDTMPDPTQPPSATAPTTPAQPPDGAGAQLPPEDQDKAMKYAQHLINNHPVFKYCAMKYAQEAGGGNTFVPAGPQRNSGSDELRGNNQAGQIRAIWAKDPHGDYHPDAHARGASGMTPDRYQRDLAERDQRIAALERANRLERYHRTLQDLQRGTDDEPGVELDLATELEIVQDFPPERFAKHCEHIAKHYRRATRSPADPPGPMHLEPLPTAGIARGKPGKPQRMSREQVDRAVAMCDADPNLSYPEALAKVAAEK